VPEYADRGEYKYMGCTSVLTWCSRPVNDISYKEQRIAMVTRMSEVWTDNACLKFMKLYPIEMVELSFSFSAPAYR